MERIFRQHIDFKTSPTQSQQPQTSADDKGEIRHWQTVALSLAIFSISLIASLLIGLIIMLLTSKLSS